MKIFVLIAVFLVLFVIGCQNQSTSGEIKSSVQIIDCGTDASCFSANFKSCTPAKIFGGLTEIKGGTPQSCEIYMESLDNPEYTGGERLSMTCIVANTDSFEDSEMNGYGIVQKGSVCEGALYDFYASLV